ncbi:MAG: ASKHA domain-containing protein [Lachnospiraceae bacterium]|nr:ASKHA domain-containing protein [Lachnospiraceae bacterium]
MQQTISRKIYLELPAPTEDDARGDRERILEAIPPEYGEVRMPLPVLRTLYPMCRDAAYHLTVTLVFCGTLWEVLRVEPSDTTDRLYGAAVDYGSTTLVMQVVDLLTGEVLTEQSIFNRQIPYGEEILSRIFYTKDNPEHLKELQQVTADSFNALVEKCERACGIPKEQYTAMTVGGNTTMMHFLLGLYPWPIFETPYAPVAENPGFLRAEALGIHLPGYVYLFPAAANYLGGDIISGLTATGIDESPELSVFIDIGTNGELVAGNSEFLLAGAGAAGPALEGGISRYGMRADTGAVDRVRIVDGKLQIHTIGEASPRGICGSGIVDLLAELFLNGWVDSLGRLNEGRSERIITVKNHLDEEQTELAVCYAWADESAQGENLVFTQHDITEFMRTKAAAHTMVSYLIESFGLEAADVKRFYLAGAFGKYLNVESAVTIGMYPDLPREKFVLIGNASLKGAYRLLLDLSALEAAQRILKKITYVQFANAGDFVEKMHAAQFLPYTDLTQYPSVKKKLEERKQCGFC